MRVRGYCLSLPSFVLTLVVIIASILLFQGLTFTFMITSVVNAGMGIVVMVSIGNGDSCAVGVVGALKKRYRKYMYYRCEEELDFACEETA